MAGGGSKNQTVTQQIDPWVKDQWMNAQGKIDQWASTLAPAPTSRPTADWNGYRDQALQLGQDAAGMQSYISDGTARTLQGFQAPTIDAPAMTAASAASRNFTDVNLDPYMSPYTSSVIDQAMKDINREGAIVQNQSNQNAAAESAFGGSRHAIINAENNRNLMESQARTTANLRDQAFARAAGLAQSDLEREARTSLANAQFQQQASSQNAEAQMRAGIANLEGALRGAGIQLSAEQQGNQAVGQKAALMGTAAQQLDALGRGVQDYELALKSAPYTQLDALQLQLGALPSLGAGGTTTTTGGGGSSLLGGLGGAATGAGLGSALALSNPWTAALAGVGGLAGLFG